MQNTLIRDQLTYDIIGAAIEVHRTHGPGLRENLYAESLRMEIEQRKLSYESQKPLPIDCKGPSIGSFRFDLLGEKHLTLEQKSVKELPPVHETQLPSYLRLSGMPIGPLVNFNLDILKNRIRRMVS